MTSFFGTFGAQSAFRKHYIEIVIDQIDSYAEKQGGTKSSTAGEVMSEHFGKKWSMLYTEDEKAPCIDNYNLKFLGTIIWNYPRQPIFIPAPTEHLSSDEPTPLGSLFPVRSHHKKREAKK